MCGEVEFGLWCNQIGPSYKVKGRHRGAKRQHCKPIASSNKNSEVRVSSYPGLSMFFDADFSRETLKNMERPGYEARFIR